MAGRKLDRLAVALRDTRAWQGCDPTVLRTLAVAAVREAARAPCALFYAPAALPGGPRMARNVVLDGDRAAVEGVIRSVIDLPERYATGLPDFRRASPFERRAFVEAGSIWRSLEHWQNRLVTRELYRVYGLGDQIRLLACHEGVALGWIGAFRYVDQPRFGPADRRRMAPLVDLVTRLLAEADRQERDAIPLETTYAVLQPGGHIEQVSPSATSWFRSPASAETVSAVVREATVLPLTAALSGSLAVVVQALEGGDGPRRLVRLEPLPPIVLTAEAVLSGTQRLIAEMLCAAVTYEEIARHLGSSPETVRSHVRTIYRRLDVSNRTELAQALDGPPPTACGVWHGRRSASGT